MALWYREKYPLAMGTSKGADKHPHMHTNTQQPHQSRLSNTGSHTDSHTATSNRTVLHEHTRYISPEVRQKSKDLTRQVKGIQGLEAAEKRG